MTARRLASRCAVLMGALLLTGCPRQSVPELERATPTPTPTPSPTPIFIPRRALDTADLYNGITVRSTFESKPGRDATTERNDKSSYTLDLALRITIPKPHNSVETLSRVNPKLPAVLPGLGKMLEGARVSPFFEDLYARKVGRVEGNLTRLDRLLSRHNFYDCETVLEMQHPETGRKILLVQADMDVDADGSDADRVAYVDGSTPYYQPMTSYKWDKRSDRPNPVLEMSEKKLAGLQRDYGVKGLSAARNRELKQQIGEMQWEIGQLRTKSFLVSEYDPYVVIPGNMVPKRGQPYTPYLGDYCVVVHGDTVYPAIVGDVGPSFKMGEASLRMSKTVNPASTAYSRPVSDLAVTYIFFPGTADTPFGPPDLVKWNRRCEELLKEIGGHEGKFHAWENTVPPLPTPTPTPTPTPSPSPSASPAPSITPAPSASP